MKEKILNFVIGVLVGAILATGGFVVYEKNKKSNEPQNLKNGTRQEMKQRRNSTERGTPPELPDGEMPADMPEGEQPTENGSTDAQTKSRGNRGKKASGDSTNQLENAPDDANIQAENNI